MYVCICRIKIHNTTYIYIHVCVHDTLQTQHTHVHHWGGFRKHLQEGMGFGIFLLLKRFQSPLIQEETDGLYY